MKVAGFELVVDPRVPPGEVWFIRDQILVGRIVGIRCPTTWERFCAWFAGLFGEGEDEETVVGPMLQGRAEGSDSGRQSHRVGLSWPPPTTSPRDAHWW